MLIFTRKPNETVVVGGTSAFQHLVKVTVIKIESNRVKLGFEAHADIPVHRMEVWKRISEEERQLTEDIDPITVTRRLDGARETDAILRDEDL